MRIELNRFPKKYEPILLALIWIIDAAVVVIYPRIVYALIALSGFDSAMRALKMKSADGISYVSGDGCRAITLVSQSNYPNRRTRIRISIHTDLGYDPI